MDRRSTVQVNKEWLMGALKSSGAGEEGDSAAEKQDWDSVINEELAAVGQVAEKLEKFDLNIRQLCFLQRWR